MDGLCATDLTLVGPHAVLSIISMKILSLIAIIITAVTPLFAAEPTPKSQASPAASASPTPDIDQPIGPLKTQKDKISYSIGLDIGSTLKRQSIDVDESLMGSGIRDGLSGNKPLLTDEQTKLIMSRFQKDMMEKQVAVRKASGEKNSAEGKKFLEENKKKEGVKTTASGLQYKVLKEGSGTSPKETDTVKVNYRGTTIDGKEFDSSYKRGQPATFPVNRVIKGWTEGLQVMKPGGKYQFFIPSDLAYGERGAGPDIGPNATLLFDVELIDVEKPTPTPPPHKSTYDSSRPPGQSGAAIPTSPKPKPSPTAN